MTADPYRVLGVARSASETELRAAYRRLVQRHHPDHNSGSPESARRFAEIQDAYARVRGLRATTVAAASDATVDERLAEIERELRAERAAAARRPDPPRATRSPFPDSDSDSDSDSGRATDEQLGYVRTDDSLTKILDDWLDGKG